MNIDLSQFHLHNITDTCSVWNLLASRLFYSTARSAGCFFYCSRFVYYECLNKPRQTPLTSGELELRRRLQQEHQNGAFSILDLEIDDLQEVTILNNRKRLSKGELSTIVLANKMQQAVLTDDDKAVKLAKEVMNPQMVQTTPHLFGWLYFHNKLGDSEKNTIIADHNSFGRNTAARLEMAYQAALHYRLLAQHPQNAS